MMTTPPSIRIDRQRLSLWLSRHHVYCVCFGLCIEAGFVVVFFMDDNEEIIIINATQIVLGCFYMYRQMKKVG